MFQFLQGTTVEEVLEWLVSCPDLDLLLLHTDGQELPFPLGFILYHRGTRRAV